MKCWLCKNEYEYDLGTKCDKCGKFFCYKCQGITKEDVFGMNEGICPDCQEKYNIRCKACENERKNL